MRVIASDESRTQRLTTAIFHGTSPRGERSSTEAVAEVQMVIAKGKLGQKSQQRRVMWPLREGREIWGVDGAFASMTWRRHCVRDGVAPSANELVWFYMGSDSVTRKAVPKRKKATQCWVTYERELRCCPGKTNCTVYITLGSSGSRTRLSFPHNQKHTSLETFFPSESRAAVQPD